MTKFILTAARNYDFVGRLFAALLPALLCICFFQSAAIAQDEPSDPPIAIAGPDIFTEFGATVRLDGSGSISPDGTPLIYVWTETVSGTVIGDGPVIAYTVIDGGFVDLTLSVSYIGGAVVTDDLTVSTQSVTPIANAGFDRTVVAGETIRLDGSASQDQTGAKLSYVWTLVEAPEDSTASLSDANAIRPAFTPDLEGLYAFDLNVSNENGRLSEPARLTLSTANSSPAAFAGPDRLANIGEITFFDPQGTIDSDGDALSAEWTLIHAPAGSGANLAETEGGRFALMPDVAGAYVAQLEISDSMGTSYDHAVLLVGAAGGVNVPPTANAGQDISLIGNAPILLDGSQSSDTDGDRLEYSWAILSAPAGDQAILSNADQPAATLAPSGAGTYVVQLTVKDSFGGVDRDVILVSSDDLSANAISGDDAAIIDDAAMVDSSLSASSNTADTIYNWSALGLTGPEADIATPDQLITDVTFTRQGSGTLSHPQSVLGLEVLQKYSLFTTYDHYAKANVQGRAAIGGKSKGGYSRYGTGLGDTTGTDVLSVQKGIYWGWRKAHGGGNIRTGGRVRARAYTHHPGRVIYDRHLEFWTETESVRKLSHELADLPATSDYAWVGPRSHGIISLPAVPDNSGVAVFHFENAASLLSNYSVRKIKLEANGANTIIINIANGHVGVNKPHLIGDFLDRDTASKVIWNFHEASRLKIYKPLVGSVLAPYAHTSMYAPIKGSVAVKTLTQYAEIHLPVFKGDGLAPTDSEDPVKLSLLQLAASNASGFAPDYATTLVSVGNLRPVGVLTSSTVNGGSVEPGESVLFDSAMSRDDGQNVLQRQWSILRAPEGALLPEGEVLTAVSLELTPELSGDYIVQLVVTDGELTSKPVTYRVRIENEPPVANAGEDQNSLKGNLVAFDGTSSSDPEGNALSYAWAIASAPDGSTATLINADTATPSFTPDIPGVYEVSLKVSDGVLVSEADLVRVTIENRAPVAIATGMTDGFSGVVKMVSGQQSTDADGDELTYTWSIAGPEGSTAQFIDPFIVDPSFTPDVAGEYTLSLVVFDGFVESTPATLVLNISDANSPPVLDSIGDKTVALGGTISFQVSAVDPDGDDVSYGLNPLPLPAGARFDATSGVFSFTPTSSALADFNLSFSASDGVLSDFETVSVTISDDDADTSTRIAGRVVDAVTKEPLTGVMIMVGDIVARTDSDGRFLLTNIEPSENLIWIAADNITQTDTNGASYISSQATISLVSGVLNSLPADLELTSGATVVNVNNSAPIVIEDSGRNIKVEIPTETIQKLGAESRYWRLLFNEVVSSQDPNREDTVEINEFFLGNTSSEGNLLTGGTAFASSNFNSTSLPERAFDGRSNLTWRSSAADFPGAWVAYDLGEGRSVFADSLEVQSGRSALSSPFRSPTDFDLQISNNGIEWTTIRNFTSSSDWEFRETRRFSIFPTYEDDLYVSKISEAQTALMPVGTNVCDMFTIGPKGINFVNPIEVSISNVDDLPVGTPIDVLVFTKSGFQPRGTGVVSQDGDTITATLRALRGGDIFAFAPKSGDNAIAIDQAKSVYVPSLLNEGNYSTANQLPGYRSNGANRGLSFVYNSTAANPTPIVAADIRLGAAIPESVSSFIEVGGVTYPANERSTLSGASVQSGDTLRQAVQLDAKNLATGSNTYKFISVSDHGCAKVATVSEGNLFVDNQSESPFGRGWSLAELSRIYPQENGAVLVREGNGTLKNFPAQADFSTLGDPVRLPLLGPYRGKPFDLDRDGDQDILWISPEQSGIVVYENAGNETFVNRGVLQAAGFVDVPEQGSFGPDLTGVAVGDIDGDGSLDIVTGSQSTDGVFVFYGTLDDFSYSEVVQISDRDVRDIEIADVDADGRDDVIIMSATSIGTTEAFMISVSPDREPTQQLFVGLRNRNFIGIDIKDINDDGIPDVLGRGRTYIGVWLGRAGDVPIEEEDVNSEFANTLGDHEAFVDLNGDGQDELLVGERGPDLRVYERQSNGRYTLIETLEVPGDRTGATEFTIADLNGNGLEDIILFADQDIVTFFNLEDGLVSAPELVDVGFNVNSIRIADFDGDGGVDVVADSQLTDELFVYYSDPSRTSRFIDPLTDYTRLTRNEDGSYNRRYNDGTTIVYTAAGLQSSTTDSNGNVTGYEYDSQGRLLRITDPVGLVTSFNYGANDRLSSIDYPDGRSAEWTYNAAGDLIRSTDVNGDVSIYDYDEVGRLTGKTDPRGLQTEVNYDAAGRYSGSKLPDGTELSLELARTLGLPELGGGEFVEGSGGTTSVTDGRGNVTETLINDFGSPLRVTDPLGRVTIYERDADNNVIVIIAPSSVTAEGTLRTEIDYDSRGNVIAKREAVGTSNAREMTYAYEPEFNKMISMVDYDGFETTYTYDAFGNQITSTDPLGGVIIMTYDTAGLPTSQTDKNNNLTTFSYNALGLLGSSEDASGTRQLFEYDDQGNLLRQIDDVSGTLQREMSYTYDGKNRVLTETAGDGGVTTYAYDGNDNVISTTDATGIVETRSYDDRDRLQTINDPASGTTVFTYDEDSNILRMTDALSETTEFTYDAVDRLLSSIDAKGQLRAFAYDSRDNITAVTDARANMTFMGYDELDRPISRTNPKGEQWNFAYDARDNRISATKPDGVVLLSDYDALSRLTRIAGGDIERSYSYDPQSNLLAANDNLNGLAGPDLGFTYDGENRLETATVTNLFGNAAQNNVFTYGYDALDRRASMADSFGGNTAYAYDPVDRLTQVTTPQGEVFTTNYDLAGRMLGRAAPNTTVTTRTYEDGTGRLASQTQVASDTAFNGFAYDYTDRGNIGEIAETGTLNRTKRYSYDELERLTEVAVPEAPTQDESYTLDPEGNRLSSHLSDTGETDVANRLTGDDAYTYVYDLNGNLLTKTAKPGVSRPDWSYDYDDLDQLIAVSRDGVETERYRYDAFGRRSVIETANDNAVFERTAIVNDGSDRTIDLVQDEVGAETIQNRYTHSGQVDEPLSLEVFAGDGTLDQAYTYHADHLGSIRFVTDSVGTIVNAYEYDSYGRPGFELEQVSQPFRYTGREWDQATELYHYRARQYDPETGKFLQEDPIGFAAGDLNLQRYVNNNPLRFTDPNGMSAIETGTTRGTATGSAGSLAMIGLRLNCILIAVSAAVDLAGTPDLETLDVVIAGGETAMACGAKAKFKKRKKKKNDDNDICPLTCFAAGTKVHTRDGLKNIEDISPGDMVKSMDPITGEVAYKSVLNTYVNRFDSTGVIGLIDEKDGSRVLLTVTAEHPFFHSEKGWVHSSKLAVNDEVLEHEGGTLKVTTVIFDDDAPISTTYNLEVADFHTYFVGQDGALVHNARIRGAKRLSVWDQCGGTCDICDKILVYTGPRRGSRFDRFSVDHIIAQVLGGSDDLSNLRGACVPCNSKKGSKPL